MLQEVLKKEGRKGREREEGAKERKRWTGRERKAGGKGGKD